MQNNNANAKIVYNWGIFIVISIRCLVMSGVVSGPFFLDESWPMT
jgi:hypothetical protein